MTAALPKKVPVRLEHTGSAPVDRAQRLAQQTATAHEQTKAYVKAQATASIAPLGGQFLRSKTVSTAGTALPHTLGRIPTGYVITRVTTTTAAAPYILADNGSHTTTTLNLLARCSTGGAQTITCDLYVF